MPSITKLAFRTGAAAAGVGAFALQKTAELLRGLAGDAGDTAQRSAERFRAAGHDASQAAEQGADRLRSVATEQAQRAGGDGDGDQGATEVPVQRRGARSRTVEPLIPPEKAPENPAAPAGGDTTATSGTGAVPRRISNPKAARKVRKRAEQAKSVTRLEASEAKKRGGRPAAKAENTPSERSQNGKGREAAPMGSTDDAGGASGDQS